MLLKHFAKIVRQFPHNTAIDSQNEKITYHELNHKANEFAHFLLSKGAKANDIIAVSMEANSNLIITFLGILKIGAIYLPISPEYPKNYIEKIIEDAKVNLFINQSVHSRINLAGSKVGGEDVEINLLRIDHSQVMEPALHKIACIFYTSGSTGRPKGVYIRHEAIVNLVCSTNYLQITPDDRLAQVANITFDAMTFEIWGALLNGACLCPISKKYLINIPQFKKILHQQKISILFLTTAYAAEIIEKLPQTFVSLKTLYFGGEALTNKQVKQILNFAKSSTTKIFHMYGPTECTTFSTFYPIKKNFVETMNAIPIGKPISGVECHIFDGKSQITKPGMVGELYISGYGVADGYLNQPELTRARFVMIATNGLRKRAYKTGDYVKYLESGDMVFVGRVDQLVKINGYRIELTEVETNLNSHPLIKQAVVIIKNLHNKYLIAFCVLHQPTEDSDKLSLKIKKDLQKNLPTHLVPTIIRIIDKFPLTLNGKINRQLLSKHVQTKDVFYIPKNKLERKLINIWQDILHLAKITASDLHKDFFELGGTSLQLTRLLFDFENAFNRSLPFIELTGHLTVINLMAYLEKSQLDKKNLENQFQNDLQLVKDLFPLYEQPSLKKIKSIFLTGASGFLGIHLLFNLIEYTSAKIYCLIRAKSIKEAKARIKYAATLYNFSIEKLYKRVIYLAGDIGLLKFNLDDDQYQFLTQSIDVIYHNAANVNMILSYHKLRSENVLSTIEIVKMAITGKNKPIHYISTIAAATEALHDFYQESPPSTHPGRLATGYQLTKWMSERILFEIKNRGLPVRIYRPSLISGQSDSGSCNLNDEFLQLIKGCLQMKSAPQLKMILQLMPVNFVSLAIIQVSFSQNEKDIFHIANPKTISWNQLICWLQEFGFEIQLEPVAIWVKKVKSIHFNNPIYRYLSKYANIDLEKNPQELVPLASTTNANGVLKSLDCPSIDKNFFHSILSTF